MIDRLQEEIFNSLMEIGWLQPRLSESDIAEIAEDVATGIAVAFPELTKEGWSSKLNRNPQ